MYFIVAQTFCQSVKPSIAIRHWTCILIAFFLLLQMCFPLQSTLTSTLQGRQKRAACTTIMKVTHWQKEVCGACLEFSKIGTTAFIMDHHSEHSEMHFSTLETRSRISSFQSHALRRDREFLSSFSCFETRPRRMLKKMHFDSSMNSCLRMISISIISKTSSLVKIVFLNFCFHFCQNV